jgi:hypothetical protein
MDNTSPLLFALNLPSIVDISKGSSTMTFSAQAVDFRVQGLDNLGIDYVCSRKLKIHQFRKLVITQAAGLNYVISK